MVEGMLGVYEAAEWLCGHPVFTHELGERQERMREVVRAQRPNFPVDKPDDWERTREAILDQFGPEIEFVRGTDKRTAGPSTTLAAAIKRAKGGKA
jgi:hypothetical protein